MRDDSGLVEGSRKVYENRFLLVLNRVFKGYERNRKSLKNCY